MVSLRDTVAMTTWRPERGSISFTMTVAFAAVLATRLLLVLLLAFFVADVTWTLLMCLSALGYACVMALAAGLIDWASRRFPAARFSVLLFGWMFLLFTYLVAHLFDLVFLFLPYILLLTGPLLLVAALLGIGVGLLLGGGLKFSQNIASRGKSALGD
jgi:hypothetical protein